MMRYAYVAILLLALAGASYAQKYEEPVQEATEAVREAGPKATQAVQAEVGADGVQRVSVVSGSYYFRPNNIVLKVGVPAELTISKEGGMAPHSFVVSAPDAGMDVRVEVEKQPKVVAFTPRAVGMYSFYCDKKLLFFRSHRDRGMVGTIEVVE
jgi:plastocyanin domain-containing protein